MRRRYTVLTAPRRPGPCGLHWRGFVFGMTDGARVSDSAVVLFLDYQNVYRCARESFDLLNSPYNQGHLSPAALGGRILQKTIFKDRQLQEVRVYRGRPAATKDPKGYGADRLWVFKSRVIACDLPRYTFRPGYSSASGVEKNCLILSFTCCFGLFSRCSSGGAAVRRSRSSRSSFCDISLWS